MFSFTKNTPAPMTMMETCGQRKGVASRKIRLLALIVLLCLCCTGLAAAQDVTTIKPGYYCEIRLSPGESAYYWDRGLNSGLAVYTLKHESGDSDFDIFIKDSGRKTLLRSGTNGGKNSELLVLPTSTTGDWLFLEVKNVGSRVATYNLYPRKIGFAEQFGQAFKAAIFQGIIKWAIGAENEESSANASRFATAFTSLMVNRNLASVAKDVVINEITTRIQRELGLKGFWADVANNFVAGTIGEVYEDYVSR
jgi:hypothetical protein